MHYQTFTLCKWDQIKSMVLILFLLHYIRESLLLKGYFSIISCDLFKIYDIMKANPYPGMWKGFGYKHTCTFGCDYNICDI